jgi:phage head maturation protease
VRELVNVELVEVAPVAVPPYEATSVSARALQSV